MTDWKWFKSSKYPAICDYCKAPIDLNAGRWSAKEGQYRYNACAKCLAPPDYREREGPPPLRPETTVQPTIDGKALPAEFKDLDKLLDRVPPEKPRESREDAIERMHGENVAAMRELTNTLFNFAAVVDMELRALHASSVERNMLIKERMQKEAK